MSRPGGDATTAVGIALALFLVYNANGREIGSYDSQPTKFAARELLLRGTLALNHVVGAVPAYSERTAFARALDGRYRSAYSPVSSVVAAGIVFPLARTGLLDLRSNAAPSVISKIGASAVTAVAVAILFLCARGHSGRGRSVVVAAGLGLGTGLWPVVSQTLWQHESALLGMAIAMLGFASVDGPIGRGRAVAMGVGLAIAGAARPQLSPMIAVLLAGLWFRGPRQSALLGTAIVGTGAAALLYLNWRWFGALLGPLSTSQQANETVHRVRGWIDWRFGGALGLLISPNRGLLVFSPVVAIAAWGLRTGQPARWLSPLRWCAIAVAAQFVMYSGYSVWWAGHTYGPRYMLDVLPLLVPLAAAALGRLRFGRIALGVSIAAFTWSVAVAATGAFCYPNDEWNTSPVDVNREHARLWQWSDMQIVRCWRAGASPQNFQLLEP